MVMLRRVVFLCLMLVPMLGRAQLAQTFPLGTFNYGFEGVGVTGDQRLVFGGQEPLVPQPGAAAVVVAHRLDGQVGTVTPPPGGFGNPAAQLVLNYTTSGRATSGQLLVLDNILPPPHSVPTAYVYNYSYSPSAGFSSTLAATYQLPVLTTQPPNMPDGIGYIGGVTALPNGGIAIADALVGAIWTCDASYACHLGDLDPAFGVGPFTVEQGIGRAPGGGTQPFTLTVAAGILPGLLGVTYATATDEICGYVVAAPGGVYCLQRSVLLDNTVPPVMKTKRALIPPQVGVSDGWHGIAYDVWNPTNPWVYGVRAIADVAGGSNNVIRRVNLYTGEIQIVAESLVYMDFETGLATIPPLVDGSPFTHLAAMMGQEEYNPLINTSCTGTCGFISPTYIAGVIVCAY